MGAAASKVWCPVQAVSKLKVQVHSYRPWERSPRKEVCLHIVAAWMAFGLSEAEFLLTSAMGFMSKLLKKMGGKNELQCYQDFLHKNSRGREGNVWKKLYDRWGEYDIIIAFFNC